MRIVAAVIASFTTLLAGTACGQAYPNKPIHVLTATAGTGLDVSLRIVANGAQESLGQPLVIENRPPNTFPMDSIAKAPPDGYLLSYYANNVWLAPFIRVNPPYDPIKDLAPVSLVGVVPNFLAVGAQLPVKSVSELVAMAKAKPGELNAYTAGSGSPAFALLLFETATGAKFTWVNYKGIGQGLNDLAAGRIQVMFPTLTSAAPMMKAGKIKGLAVTTRERTSLSPDLPALAASGYPDFESVSAQALIAPPKTPAAIINRLNKDFVGFVRSPAAREKLNALGIDVVGSTPEELGKYIQAEMTRMGPAFKAAGIKPGDWAE